MDYDQLATIDNQNDLWCCLQEQPYGVSERQYYSTLTDAECFNFLEFDPCLELDFSQSQPKNDPMLNDSLHECLTTTNILEFDQCLDFSQQQNYPIPTFEYFNDFDIWWNTNLSMMPHSDNEPALIHTEPVKPITNLIVANDHINDFSNDVNMMEEGESSSSASDHIRMKRQLKRSKPKSSGLELEEIKNYFHLPITKAAKELRVGVTVLKKRCRELNIARWPHRKIKSLKFLIHNVKELGILTNENEIEMLEEHKRAIERVPGQTLTARTKKLRQACFKASYKKRRLLPHHTTTTTT